MVLASYLLCLFGRLAVHENLMFACKMYNPDLSQGDRECRVNEVLANLGLESCRDTKVRQLAYFEPRKNATPMDALALPSKARRRILFTIAMWGLEGLRSIRESHPGTELQT